MESNGVVNRRSPTVGDLRGGQLRVCNDQTSRKEKRTHRIGVENFEVEEYRPVREPAVYKCPSTPTHPAHPLREGGKNNV